MFATIRCMHLYYNSPFKVCLSVTVSKLRVAILARSSREMSQTVRIYWMYILSRVRVSVRPRIFLYAKNTQNLGKTGPPVFISMASDQPLSPAERAVTVGCHQGWGRLQKPDYDYSAHKIIDYDYSGDWKGDYDYNHPITIIRLQLLVYHGNDSRLFIRHVHLKYYHAWLSELLCWGVRMWTIKLSSCTQGCQ